MERRSRNRIFRSSKDSSLSQSNYLNELPYNQCETLRKSQNSEVSQTEWKFVKETPLWLLPEEIKFSLQEECTPIYKSSHLSQNSSRK
eukprot:EST43051.1 Hypothetical protein SS50377_17354 [Spironucleus salmonicida]